jgi:hypothetical protein
LDGVSRGRVGFAQIQLRCSPIGRAGATGQQARWSARADFADYLRQILECS